MKTYSNWREAIHDYLHGRDFLFDRIMMCAALGTLLFVLVAM